MEQDIWLDDKRRECLWLARFNGQFADWVAEGPDRLPYANSGDLVGLIKEISQ